MTYGTTSLKLETAQQIFTGVDIQPIVIAEKVAGYRAVFKDHVIEDATLWRLAQKLWNANT